MCEERLYYGAHSRNGTCTALFVTTVLEKENAVDVTVGAVSIAILAHGALVLDTVLMNAGAVAKLEVLISPRTQRRRLKHSWKIMQVSIWGLLDDNDDNPLDLIETHEAD
ncbi:hypothetical protein N7522_013834 [Penicillium canescens]|nr:hypothetical protein N7522_013834 [Penicillium canescens]